MLAGNANALLRSLAGEKTSPPPLWLMRQAGRHLPEYKELRRKAKDFLNLCNIPELAIEATLQPVKRYDLDAAIIFSDILLLLNVLGCDVRFEEGHGPRLKPIRDLQIFDDIAMSEILSVLAPVFEAIAGTRASLAPEKALIGFAGAPFTLSVYALSGCNDQQTAVQAMYRDGEAFGLFLKQLSEAVALSLAGQARAGADVLMLFDSWAGGLAPEVFRRAIIEPNRHVRSRLRELGIDKPVIGFPRAAGIMLEQYAAITDMDCIGLDTSMDLGWADKILRPGLPVQGNLDPLLLLCGGEALDSGIRAILDSNLDRPLIINLGHGVHPKTPIRHVERLIELVRGQA